MGISPRLPSVEREGRGNGSGEGSYMSHEKNGQSEENEGELESGMSKLCARGHWRPAEDTKLKELVAQYGPQNWNLIAEKLEGRSGKSCRLRWFNQLDPRINKKAFTEEEEERLLSAHRLYGNRWALIARLFPGRTDNAVKNHWHVIMARKQREQFNAYRRKKPLNTISCPSDKVFDKRLGLNCRNNASYAESTVSIKRDEPLSNKGFPFHGFTPMYSAPLQQQQQFELLFGSDEKVVASGNEFYESFFYSGSAFHHVPPFVVVQGADHSVYSDSSSDASAMESVINQNGNAFMIKEADHERKKISLPFIDFLGVGAT